MCGYACNIICQCQGVTGDCRVKILLCCWPRDDVDNSCRLPEQIVGSAQTQAGEQQRSEPVPPPPPAITNSQSTLPNLMRSASSTIAPFCVRTSLPYSTFLPIPSAIGNKNDVLFFYVLRDVLARAIHQSGSC